MSIKHGYTRVTQILSPFSGLDHVHPMILQRAGERGTRVHNACEAIITGLGEWDDDPKIAGYIHSFRQWWDKGHEVQAVEQRFYDDDLKITGAVDLITGTTGNSVIVDFKTSSKPSKTWPLQGSAYAYMAGKSGYTVSGIMFLHLMKDGSAPVEFHYKADVPLFQAVAATYNYFYANQDKEND